MKKYLVFLLVILIVLPAFSQTARPGRTPRWDRTVSWILNGQETLTYKTLASPTISGTITMTADLNLTGAYTQTSDTDTLRFILYQALYPIDLEIGNTRMFAVDSAGNVQAATAYTPDAADGATLGTAALEFSDGYFADASVLYFGADQDVTLTHVADAGLLINTTMYLSFRDNALKISSTVDGQMDIDADTELEIATATLDLNGILDVSGVSTMADEVDITKSTVGTALDVNYTATTYTTLLGVADVRRTGALTGVDTETVVDLHVLPALTFTEPASGTVNYYGSTIDLTSVAVTAGAGTSVLSALNLVAGTDADAGANWALQTTGNLNIDGYIDLDAATTVAGGIVGVYSYPYHTTNALTGSLIAVRGSARVDAIDSPAGTVMGGYFQAGNMGTGTDLSVVRGVSVEVVNKVPSGATTWTYARGLEVNMDLDQGSAGNVNTITNAEGIKVLYNLPTSGTYATVTNGYGIHVRNEAVGGTGQMLDAGFYLDDASMSGGISGWDYGIDFNSIGASGFGTADVRWQDGTVFISGYDGSPSGAVTSAKGSLCVDTTNAKLYINTDGGTTWAEITQ